MTEDENKFEPRLGRMRSQKRRKAGARALQSLLIARIARGGGEARGLGKPASPRATGRFNSRGRGAKFSRGAGHSSGWSVDPASKMRVRARRVMVKARIVKLTGAKVLGAAGAHLRYLQRDGVTREGEQGRFYSTFIEDADGKSFLARGEGDRHQFRFIVSPEDGASFDTLRSFTRELMAKMEQDLGTTLDWVAVDHFDTGHPHTHVLLRGATEDGKTLSIAGDYIAHGIRGRASEIMTRWLGPQSELEVREQLAREVDAERLTKLDRDILARTEDQVVELGKPATWDGDGSYQQLLVARVRQLERMELAEREGPLTWRLAPDLEKTLADLGRRGDIIRTMNRAMTEAKLDRRPELYVIDRAEPGAAPVVGKVVHRGTADDHHDRRFIVLDGIDGRTHYAEVPANAEPTPVGSLVAIEPARPELRPADRKIDEIARANGGAYSIDLHFAYDRSASEEFARAHVRRLEALRRVDGFVEREPDGTWRIPRDYLDKALEHERAAARAAPVRVQLLAMLDLKEQAVMQAPTWLDGQLKGEAALEVANHGYGRNARDALARRQQWLIAQGLAIVRGDKIDYRADMDDVLRQREVRTAAARLSRQLGLPFAEAAPGERLTGICRRRVDLSSGSFALVENSREFTLVPWRPVLERQLGREVSGILRDSGTISWTFGRQRSGPEIGM
jgi:type IV secretory pathway VirD2 relaxase